MVNDALGQKLHDRATRGLPLSLVERNDLESWYARKDAEESVLLLSFSSPSLAALREQLSETLAQIEETARQIRTLSSENETMREEIAALRLQLAASGVTE